MTAWTADLLCCWMVLLGKRCGFIGGWLDESKYQFSLSFYPFIHHYGSISLSVENQPPGDLNQLVGGRSSIPEGRQQECSFGKCRSQWVLDQD